MARVARPCTRWTQRAFAAQALADTVDLVAIAAAGPLGAKLLGGAMAASSSAVAAAYARRLRSAAP